MTHEEACRALEENARQLEAGTVTLAEWRTQVDLILLARFPDGRGLARVPHPERGLLEIANRTNIPPRTRPDATGRTRAARPAHAPSPA